MKVLMPCLIVLGLTPLNALAQGQIGSLHYSGIVKVENLSLDHKGRTSVYADFDLGYRFPLTEGFAIGVDLGLDAVQQKGNRGDAVFAAAVLDSPWGALSVGMPRMVIPQVFDTPALGGSEVVQLAAGLASGEILRDVNLLTHAPTLRGIRYDGHFGPVTVAAALHEFDNSMMPLRQIAVTYDGAM